MSKVMKIVIAGTIILFLVAIIFAGKKPTNLIPSTTTNTKGSDTSLNVSTGTPRFSPENEKIYHDCLVAAENFFETKRATDVDLYSATWESDFDASSGICFVQINHGPIYNVANGDAYRLDNNVFIKVNK